MRRAIGSAILVMLVLAAPATAAPLLAQVADIRPGGGDSDPSGFTELDGSVLFAADGGPDTGFELWSSDSTAAGTVMVKDIHPGFEDSFPDDFVRFGDHVYFSADDGLNGEELWRSDGSAEGTVLVKDINPGPNGSSPRHLVVADGRLFFSANDGTTGDELWSSDGSAAGTQLIHDIRPGNSSSFPEILTPANGRLYFVADDGATGEELWSSDGTSLGTTIVKDIYPGASDSMPFFKPDFFTVLGGNLYFPAEDGANGVELWRSDGTPGGTAIVKDINPGAGDSNPGGTFARNIVAGNGQIFLAASDGALGSELWRSDGTPAGTALVKDIFTGSAGSGPGALEVFGSTLFFSASSDGAGAEPWRSDGSEAGTVMISDVYPGPPGSGAGRFLDFDGAMVFPASDGVTGSELWQTDGSAEGTSLIADVNPGANNFQPSGFVPFAGGLLFSGQDPAGRELWRIDAVPPGLTATAKKKRPLKRTLRTLATCDEACEVAAGGKVIVKPRKGGKGAASAKRISLKLRGDSVSLRTGEQGTLSLQLNKKGFKKAKRAKREKAKLKANITIVATDVVGHETAQRLRVALK